MAIKLRELTDEEKAAIAKLTRSRTAAACGIDEVLIAEGLRWRTQETWFGERVDPELAKKRGSLKRSTPTRLKTAR